jgi:hypothetical protein
MVALTPADDIEAAEWIAAALRTFAKNITSLVPAGYPAYVRVFHPAYRDQQPLRWSEIAVANGTQAHAGMQLCGLTGSYRFEREGQPGVYDRPPTEGSLPAELRPSLARVLSQHTTTPERCWFAVWNGFGTNAQREHVQRAPTFKVPAREYHLLRGAVESSHDETLTPPWSQSANIWWPDDHAWCVATEIDLKTTYVACSAACRDALIAATDLEAMPIDPATGISWDSDDVNPKPPPRSSNT